MHFEQVDLLARWLMEVAAPDEPAMLEELPARAGNPGAGGGVWQAGKALRFRCTDLGPPGSVFVSGVVASDDGDAADVLVRRAAQVV